VDVEEAHAQHLQSGGSSCWWKRHTHVTRTNSFGLDCPFDPRVSFPCPPPVLLLLLPEARGVAVWHAVWL